MCAARVVLRTRSSHAWTRKDLAAVFLQAPRKGIWRRALRWPRSVQWPPPCPRACRSHSRAPPRSWSAFLGGSFKWTHGREPTRVVSSAGPKVKTRGAANRDGAAPGAGHSTGWQYGGLITAGAPAQDPLPRTGDRSPQELPAREPGCLPVARDLPERSPATLTSGQVERIMAQPR